MFDHFLIAFTTNEGTTERSIDFLGWRDSACGLQFLGGVFLPGYTVYVVSAVCAVYLKGYASAASPQNKDSRNEDIRKRRQDRSKCRFPWVVDGLKGQNWGFPWVAEGLEGHKCSFPRVFEGLLGQKCQKGGCPRVFEVLDGFRVSWTKLFPHNT